MSGLVKTFHINKTDFLRAGEASIHVKNLLKSLNVNPSIIRRVSICGYEGEMNVVMHGGDGILSVEITPERITLHIMDDGPGIENIELAMQKGYSTASEEFREKGFGAGMGLPNMKQNADEFHIESEKDMGTHVRMKFIIDH